MKTITLTYDELVDKIITEKLMSHPIVVCNLPAKYAMALRSNWSKYHRYWESKDRSPGSLLSAFYGVMWIIHRTILGIRYPNLEFLIQAYTGHGYMMEPVQFENENLEKVNLIFRRKGTKP